MIERMQAYTLPYAEAFDLTSSEGTDFRISVGFPMTYSSGSLRYPVAYLLDADLLFSTMLGISRLRAIGRETAEIVVVGIGYEQGLSILELFARRIYDFTVSTWDLSTPIGKELQNGMAATGQSLRLGGAPELLRFITEDLQPLINRRYRIDPTDRALFGYSASGNFVAHALFRRREAFEKYIAASPAFVYNDWHAFQLEEEYAKGHTDLPVTLYLAAGSDEIVQLSSNGIVSGTARMAEVLQQRAYPGLRLTAEVFASKTHGAAITEVMQRGLEICWPCSKGTARDAPPEYAFHELVSQLTEHADPP
jgi:predicted alpha/beta superfamily hydrolase